MVQSKKCKVVLQDMESKAIGGHLKYFHNINIQMDNQVRLKGAGLTPESFKTFF